MNDDYTHLYKIVLVGDAGVGKTHILNRYIKGNLPKNPAPTIGVEFATRTITLKDGSRIKAQIWDTAGQEKYRSITSAHYRRAVGALLVYDVTKNRSFESIQRWLEEIKAHADPGIVLLLVGNKVDLVEANPQMRKVQKKDAELFAQKNNLLFEEASAFNTNNIQDVFEKLLEEIYDQRNRILITTEYTQQDELGQTLSNKKNKINEQNDQNEENCSCGN